MDDGHCEEEPGEKLTDCEDVVEYDTDYPGDNLKQVEGVINWALCADHCVQTEECKSWTWVNAEFDILSYRLLCILKSRKPSLNREQHLVSGVKCKTSTTYSSVYKIVQ